VEEWKRIRFDKEGEEKRASAGTMIIKDRGKIVVKIRWRGSG
jgi:hypothetical protein